MILHLLSVTEAPLPACISCTYHSKRVGRRRDGDHARRDARLRRTHLISLAVLHSFLSHFEEERCACGRGHAAGSRLRPYHSPWPASTDCRSPEGPGDWEKRLWVPLSITIPMLTVLFNTQTQRKGGLVMKLHGDVCRSAVGRDTGDGSLDVLL